jgi:hypothetical protein
MRRVWNVASTEGRRLLRVLLVRIGEMSAGPGVRQLLRSRGGHARLTDDACRSTVIDKRQDGRDSGRDPFAAPSPAA